MLAAEFLSEAEDRRVGEIDGVGPELQRVPFGNREVLAQAEVRGLVSGTIEGPHRAIAERSFCRFADRRGIQKVNSARSRIEGHRNCIRKVIYAVCARRESSGTGRVAGCEDGLRKPGMEDEARTQVPPSDHGIHKPIRLTRELLAAPKGELVDDVAVK